MDAVTRADPHAVLLGGDLVDHHSELCALGHLVATLGAVAPVFAVGGNHDRQVGMEKVHAAVQQAGGQWIHGSFCLLTHGGRVIAVAGPESAPPVEAHVRVLCAHDPRIWRTARHDGYHLVLAGHLHGCQFVAWEYRRQLFPGALFYRYCCSSRHSGSARLVVSRGVTDLVPIRWKCPREVVLCHV
jgi:predicted MPP superfamily phosphohydrolase